MYSELPCFEKNFDSYTFVTSRNQANRESACGGTRKLSYSCVSFQTLASSYQKALLLFCYLLFRNAGYFF